MVDDLDQSLSDLSAPDLLGTGDGVNHQRKPSPSIAADDSWRHFHGFGML